jgi:acetyl-CoA C-acetyltransferase
MRALQAGEFDAEVAAVSVQGRKGAIIVERDETPGNCDVAKIPQLKPAFSANGTVTAASSSSISDGAAAVVLARESVARQRDLRSVARLVAWTSNALAPEWFTIAPVAAIEKVLKAAGWGVKDVDLFEINEAFAVVAMAAMRDLKIDPQRLNVNGGACALGHPVGATGARIITTLIHALQKRGGKRGVAALCIGGGEATAVAIELR